MRKCVIKFLILLRFQNKYFFQNQHPNYDLCQPKWGSLKKNQYNSDKKIECARSKKI